jgi:hypothetical protein
LAPHPAGNTEVFLLELTFVEHQLLQPRRRETACRPRTSAGPDESRGSG